MALIAIAAKQSCAHALLRRLMGCIDMVNHVIPPWLTVRAGSTFHGRDRSDAPMQRRVENI